jgi:hypothetical protein
LYTIRKPKFNKISWTKENVKTLGVHHGYNVDNDKIWKDIIDRTGHPCLHERDMEKNSETNPFVFMDVVAFLTNI